MEKSEEEKQMSNVGWPLLFLVTGISLIGFSFVMKFLDGKQPKLMLWGGAISLLLSLILFLGGKPNETPKKENDL